MNKQVVTVLVGPYRGSRGLVTDTDKSLVTVDFPFDTFTFEGARVPSRVVFDSRSLSKSGH